MKKMSMVFVIIVLLSQIVFSQTTGHRHLKGGWYIYAISSDGGSFKSIKKLPFLFIIDRKIKNFLEKSRAYPISYSERKKENGFMWTYIEFKNTKQVWLIKENEPAKDVHTLIVVNADKTIDYKAIIARENRFK